MFHKGVELISSGVLFNLVHFFLKAFRVLLSFAICLSISIYIGQPSSQIKKLPRSLFLLSKMLYNADIWQNYTLGEVNLENQK